MYMLCSQQVKHSCIFVRLNVDRKFDDINEKVLFNNAELFLFLEGNFPHEIIL